MLLSAVGWSSSPLPNQSVDASELTAPLALADPDLLNVRRERGAVALNSLLRLSFSTRNAIRVGATPYICSDRLSVEVLFKYVVNLYRHWCKDGSGILIDCSYHFPSSSV